MLRQLDLLSTGAPSFDTTFADRERLELAQGAWIDRVPGWVRGHDALFDELERDLPWRHETMKMYDKIVDVPRLLAQVPSEGAGQPLIEGMRQALSHHYGETFVYVSAALYRGGSDSVAMHGDTTARNMLSSLVATVSLGAPRGFVMRPTEGGASRTLSLGHGDLVVMGGSFQRTWRHGIPKVASAGPRIALMFRPAWARDYRSSADSRSRRR